MTIEEEIPKTEEGLRLYIIHSLNQIKKSNTLIFKLKKRIKVCVDRAKLCGFRIKDLEPIDIEKL